MESRIFELSERASCETDSFARDRLVAGVHHLERIRDHRDALAAERGRAAALAEFATVFLEEARSELTLAGVQSTVPNPERLPEVLDRLRTYSAERASVRQVRREMTGLVC